MKRNKNVTISPHSLRLSEYARSSWFITLPRDHTEDDLVAPEYYAHIASQLKPFDKIEFFKEDMTLYLEAVVIDVTSNAARVKIIRTVPLGKEVIQSKEEIEAKKAGFEVNWAGPVKRWRVLRVSNKEELVSGLSQREDGEDWIDKNIRSLV